MREIYQDGARLRSRTERFVDLVEPWFCEKNKRTARSPEAVQKPSRLEGQRDECKLSGGYCDVITQS